MSDVKDIWIVYVWGMDEASEYETFAEANRHCTELNNCTEYIIKKHGDVNIAAYASIFKREHFDSWQASISDGK